MRVHRLLSRSADVRVADLVFFTRRARSYCFPDHSGEEKVSSYRGVKIAKKNELYIGRYLRFLELCSAFLGTGNTFAFFTCSLDTAA